MLDKIQMTRVIPLTSANKRLDQALVELMPDFSRTQIKQWIENGNVLLNEKKSKAKMKVKGGETVSVDVTLTPEREWEAEEIPLEIIYEEPAFMIINKPVGLVVHPGAGNFKGTLLNALLHHNPKLKQLPRAGILHRLDKDTSGLLLIAKTPAALKHLSHQLKKRHIVREYQAVVLGTLISGATIDAPIERDHIKRKRMAVSEAGKKAVTHYRVLERYRAHTRVKVNLETGRTHQIRVHFAHIRHPVVGDPVYSGRLQLKKGMSAELIEQLRKFKRQALHAYALGFTHPISEEPVRFEIDLPEDMEQLIQVLRKDQQQ